MISRPIKKAILPVAGLGTRFLPATKALPKEMLTVVDKPLVQYAVEEAFAAGIEDIILVTGRGKSAIENHFDRAYELESLLEKNGRTESLAQISATIPKNGRLSYTRQGKPLGLGHAIWSARSLIGDEPFAVLLADDIFSGSNPVMKQMVEAYDDVGGNIVSIMEVPQEHTSRYGIISPGSQKNRMIDVKSIIEKPDPSKAPSNWAVSGRYILQPDVFDILAEGKEGAGGEIQLTDAIAQLIGKQAFHGLINEGKRFDCGNKVGWLEANICMALEREDMNKELKEILNKYANGDQG